MTDTSKTRAINTDREKRRLDIDADLGTKIRWLLVARLGMFVLITGAVVFLFSTRGFLFKLLFGYGIITLGYFISLAWWQKTRKEVSFKFLCAIQLLFELIVEAGIVHYSGGAGSPFTILFGLSIVSSAFVFELAGTLITASGAAVLYVTIVYLEFRGIIEVSARFPMVELLYEDSELLFFTAYVYVCFLYLIAFLIGYLSGRLRARIGELRETGETLQRVRMDTDDILIHMRSGLITLDPEGRIVYFNKVAGDLLGIDPDDAAGKFLSDILPKSAKSFNSKLSELLALGGQRIRTGEFSLHAEPGEEPRIMLLACSFLTSPDGSLRGIIALFEDITEQKRREEYLKEVEKMAAIGELSANLAHEIRNPLAAIRASVETLSGDEKPDETDNRRLMKLVIKETDRLTRVLDEFLVFARLKELPTDHVTYNRINLVEMIAEVLKMLDSHPVFSGDIEIVNELPDELWAFGREDQLRDVFYNLLINAGEATHDSGGTITITKAPEREGFYAGRRLVGINIIDTGAGIPEDSLSRIFNPFYSTKPRGTGLGLAIAYGIVNRHRGIIEAENCEDGGAKFTVYLLKAPEPEEGH
ncbi:hypothetical protein DRQ36_06265 [bacterium]|nr:MAG: hypothetical protein DRQ36_06265 [bacterium]